MAIPQFTTPGFNDVYNDPRFREQEDILNQQYGQSRQTLQNQLGGIRNSYNTQRADLMRSYQDQFDAINNSLRQAGIGLRGSYADRQLYDPSGQVSGVGQGYATGVLNPIYNTLQQTQGRQVQDINALQANQQQDIGNVQQQLAALGPQQAQSRFDVAQRIYDAIREAARQRYEDQVAREQEQYGRRTTAEQQQYERQQQAQQRPQQDPGSRLYNEALGRQYLGTMNDVQNAIRQYGRDAVVQVGGNYYVLSAAERQQLGLLGSGADPLGIL